MADDPLDNLRLSLMQDLLPVGLAMVERVREGGPSKVVEAFTTSSDPLQELRKEGEVAAKSVREHLDQVSPGLGNPVIPVTVDIDEQKTTNIAESCDEEELGKALERIEDRLAVLAVHLEDESRINSSASRHTE